MPSPFPGMNPYFEQPGVWRGFHTSFLVELRRAITRQAAPRYFVKLATRTYLDYDADELPIDHPAVLGPDQFGPVTARIPPAVKRKHHWLALRSADTGELVTVVELLSPTWLGGPTLRKRRRILRSAAQLVEIDFLRGGPRMPVAGVPRSDYRVMVSRQPNRPDVQVWPIGLREALPAIPIPFRTGEPEPLIDLKPLVDSVYDGGGYRYQLYDAPPEPPLSPADAEWARQFLPPAG